MRILLLSNLYPPYVQGGAEILAGDIASGLERLGHEVIVLTSWYNLPQAQQDGHIWRTLHYVSSANFDRRHSIWNQVNKLKHYYQDYHSPANAQELCHVIATTKPDLLYIWEPNGIGINSLLSVLPKLTIPIVFQLGSYWWQYTLSPETEHSHLRLRWFKKSLIGSIPPLTYTSMIAVSRTVKQKYVEVGCDPERIEVIPNGIDSRFLHLAKTEHFDGTEDANNPCSKTKGTRLLYAGRLRTEKGILVILKSLDLLVNEQRKQDFHLSIFGDGDQAYIDELQAFVRAKQLTSVVTFHGKVPQDALIKYYDLADIMLVPSLWQEPFGLVIAEAMARGLPVIASDVGGPAEIITHEENGLLVAPGDERALALAITYLSENPDVYRQFSKAALSTVRERFMLEGNARRVEQHLLRTVRGEPVNRDSPILSSSNVH